METKVVILGIDQQDDVERGKPELQDARADNLALVHNKLVATGKVNPLVVVFDDLDWVYVVFWPQTLEYWGHTPNQIISDFCRRFPDLIIDRRNMLFRPHSQDTEHVLFLVGELVGRLSQYDVFKIRTGVPLADWASDLAEFFGKL